MSDARHQEATVKGLRVGPYELQVELGRGGMGRVYRARHDASQVDVALKTVASPAATRGHLARRLLEEVRVVAQLRHPGVVEILDVGRLDATSGPALAASEGAPFIVMELAASGSLAALRHRLSFDELQVVADRMLLALGHAHAHGILHCDVKLANILRAGPGSTLDELRLADFGVAAFYGGAERPRFKGGTRAYMPPEQLAGDVRLMGPWSDLFALAKALTELLVPGAAVPPAFSRWVATCLSAHWRRRFPCAADARAAFLALCDDGERVPWRLDALGRAGATSTSETTDDTTEPSAPLSLPAIDAGPALARAPWPTSEQALTTASERVFMGDAMSSLAALRPPPLLGRQREQRALWASLASATRTHGPTFVSVEGAAGMGKTRLADWLLERASELGAARGLRAEDWHEGGALAKMVRRDLRAGGLVGPRLREHVAAMVPKAPRELLRLIDPSTTVADADAAALVADYLAMLSEERPLVLVLDDADGSAEAQALVMELTRRRGAMAVVLTGQEVSPEGRVAGQEVGRFERVLLEPLPDVAQVKLIQSLCRLDAPTALAIASRMGGNPGHAVQLVTYWLEEGHLRADATTARVEDLPLPEGMHEIAQRRLAGLLRRAPPGVGEAIELAASGGPRVHRVRWVAACEAAGLTREHCATAERLLVDGGQLRRGSVERQLALGHWRFERPAFREAVIAAMGSRRHRWHRIHASLASSLDERGLQLFEAGAYPEAFEALVEGASALWASGAHPRAQRLLEVARDAFESGDIPDEHPLRGRFLILRGRSELAVGSPADAGLLAEQAIQWGRRRRRVADELEAQLLAAEISSRGGDFEGAAFSLEEAQQRAEAQQLESFWAEAFRAWIEVAIHLPGTASAVEHAIEDAMARPAVRARAEVEGSLLLSRGQLYLHIGALDGAERDGRNSLDKLPARTMTAVRAGWFLGRVARERDQLDVALARLEQALVELQALGTEPTVLWSCRADLALVHNRGGNYARTRNLIEAAPSWFDRRGAQPMASLARLILMPTFAAFGEWERWDQTFDAAVRVGHVLPDAVFEAERAGDEALAAGERARALAAYSFADQHLFRLGRREALERVLAKRRALETSLV